MKRLRPNDPYPNELWDNTPAPEWSAERVWANIEQEMISTKQSKTWWLWLLLLVALLGSVGWTQEQEITANATEDKLIKEEWEVKTEVSTVPLPATLPDIQAPLRPSEPALEKPTPTSVPKRPEQADSVQLQHVLPKLSRPVAEISPLPRLSPVLEYWQKPRGIELPASLRPGSRLVLKVPEIPDAEARQGSFAKRIWQQYKQLHMEGEIDWVELGIQPNGDGTFSILPPAKTKTDKPN